ncbi:HAD family hydrolase [Cellulomonas triticagri]|uniref:Haloacid dehalogenase-like hydrolase n=1 Tax=Cellulomonas triticagri TaxID=2483352 RepID=A0A3M2JR09_9CELL|nr:HAD family hydrolase [Cellulomonas triticagri]RMI14280.1 haloacid dehalogenase-like hydrolase [Cellulomonas triticagri]
MADDLPGWRDGPARRAVLDFVARTTDPGGADHVEPAARVAVLDNDGTLWCERPVPVQVDFLLRRFVEMAEADPALRDRQPWLEARTGDLAWLGDAMDRHYRGDDSALRLLVHAVTTAFADVDVDAYDARVREFFATAEHPVLRRPYRECVYAPMIALLRYLEAHGYVVYLATGGDRDFVRPVAQDLYGVPPERVIGSAVGLAYVPGDVDGAPGTLRYTAAMEFFDDGPVKPVRIWSRTGRRPVVAAGNANGDVPMLGFAGSGDGPALRLLLRHDDAEREFATDAGAEQALAVAADRGWTVVSMRDDWSTVFAGDDR